MRRIMFFERLMENMRASVVNLTCIFIIALLTGACASGNNKQTSFEIPPPPSPGEVSVSQPDETDQVSAKGEAENSETDDDQKIICRTIKGTGSRIGRKKICATKAEWAAWAREQREKADKTVRDLNEASGVNTDTGPDPRGGRTMGAPR